MPTVKELKAELTSLGLSTEGKKAQLLERLAGQMQATPPDAVSQKAQFLTAKRRYAEMQARDFNKRFASK